MSLDSGILKAEESIIKSLESAQQHIDDRTGKGVQTEEVVTECLIKPFLPPRFAFGKGSVVTPKFPDKQSAAIDRIIYDIEAGPSLYHSKDHSIFPIEVVAGLIEITMSLDRTKLKKDIKRMAPIKGLTKRRYLVPDASHPNKAHIIERDGLMPRSFIIGLPRNGNWKANTIANNFGDLQLEQSTHVHGLYVLGIGYFERMHIDPDQDLFYSIRVWEGSDRYFRFTNGLRTSFDRWPRIDSGCSVYLNDYAQGNYREISKKH